jgi:transcriptional regulator with XRE-family HTH domain
MAQELLDLPDVGAAFQEMRGASVAQRVRRDVLLDAGAAGCFAHDAFARYVGVPQPNIAFWEQSEKPPRSDVLPKMAEALGVSVEDLLIVESGKTATTKAAKSNGRPAGKVREVFDRVSKLPRRQQEHIVNWVSAYVSQYEQTSRVNHS